LFLPLAEVLDLRRSSRAKLTMGPLLNLLLAKEFAGELVEEERARALRLVRACAAEWSIESVLDARQSRRPKSTSKSQTSR